VKEIKDQEAARRDLPERHNITMVWRGGKLKKPTPTGEKGLLPRPGRSNLEYSKKEGPISNDSKGNEVRTSEEEGFAALLVFMLGDP